MRERGKGKEEKEKKGKKREKTDRQPWHATEPNTPLPIPPYKNPPRHHICTAGYGRKKEKEKEENESKISPR